MNIFNREQFKAIWVNLRPDQKIDLTNRLETNKDYLSQIAHGHGTPGKHFAKALVVAVGEVIKEQAA